MKRFVIISLALAALLSLGGCDFLRSIAGRPTSKDLEAKRAAIVKTQEEARQKARLDSLEEARRRADSLAARDAHLRDSLSRAKVVLGPRKVGGLYKSSLEAKYYIIVGAYVTQSSADRSLNSFADAGYPGVFIRFGNGRLALGICPSDSLSDTWTLYRRLRAEGTCPRDAFILVNE